MDPVSPGLATGTWELGPGLALIQAMLQPNKMVLDLGAHVGTVALAIAASGCRVIAVEASPRNAGLLRAGAARNGFTHAQVVEAAVSAHAETAEFLDDGRYSYVRTLLESSGAAVEAVTVDRLLADLAVERVNLVTIDVEGWDWRLCEA